MILRNYKENDAKEILNWIKSEREFRLWSADRYNSYPITPEDINKNYEECKKISNFYPMILEDNDRIIGHIILRNPENNRDIVRLGFIIVDNNIRRKGFGRKLILESIRYAKEVLNAKEITLGVFINNIDALECYKSAGFKIIKIEKNVYKFYNEEWNCAEMVLDKSNLEEII